jgi:hypothetical protein
MIDFKNNVAELTFQELKESVDENSIGGSPFNHYMHHEFIDKVCDLAIANNLNPTIDKIEVVDSKSKYMPSISLIKKLEEVNGEKSHKNYLFRRVFCNIIFPDLSNDENVFNLAMIYHQNGVQFGIGTNVKMCQNLCILGSDYIVSSYGLNKVSIKSGDNKHLFTIINDWINNAEPIYDKGDNFLSSMKDIIFSDDQFNKLVGMLFIDKTRRNINNECSFLNDSHIIDMVSSKIFEPESTAYELYNVATNNHKPSSMDLQRVIEGNAIFTELFNNYISNMN